MVLHFEARGEQSPVYRRRIGRGKCPVKAPDPPHREVTCWDFVRTVDRGHPPLSPAIYIVSQQTNIQVATGYRAD
jgi:hypothetical protein